jgi:sterol desaturase/sphingolipid hydroxylase (fatty acid hydroxylase superfamily)
VSQFAAFVVSSVHAYFSYLVLFSALTLLELLFARGRQPFLTRLPGAMIWLAHIPASVLIYQGLYALWSALGIKPILTLPLIQSLGWAGPLAVSLAAIVGAFVADFMIYWYHRAQHRLLWRFHAVHHSIRDLNAINSYHHISEAFFAGMLIALPTTLIVVDYGPTIPILVFVTSLQAIYLHSPTRLTLGPLRAVFGDNAFHRIHHSLHPEHFDKNFGVMTTLWDRIFGTAYFPKQHEWPDVGLAVIQQPADLAEWLTLPIRYREDVDAA